MEGDPTSSIQPGDRFLDLDVLERVGRGAFATVYRARDLLLRRTVALKVFDPPRTVDHESGRSRVLREARMVAQLRSPHVVTLYRIHELPGGRWMFEFEYMDGGDLRQRLAPGRLPSPQEAERTIRAVLSGLAEAHASGIVHGDVKPANVLLGRDGTVKLTDFGLGLFSHEDSLSGKRHQGPRGTPRYMAPEVMMGSPPTPASDVWSAGVLLYCLLAGHPPFPQTAWYPLFFAIQNDPPPLLGAEGPTVLANLALHCLAKSPADRAPNAGALLEMLDAPGRVQAAASSVPSPALRSRPAPLLVGRQEPRRVLRTHLRAARAGEGRSVLVLGEAGVGKTALLQDLAREARSVGYQCLEMRLTPLEGLRRPLLQVLRTRYASDSDSETPDGSTGGSSAGRPERLAQLQHAEVEVPEAGTTRTTAVIERALVDLAAEHPLMLLIDDVHHGDREDLRLLGSLIPALSECSSLVTLAWRTRDPRISDSSGPGTTDYREILELPRVVQLDLGPLSDDAMRELIARVAEEKSLPPSLIERIIDASEGIPLYALALYRHLEEGGKVVSPASGTGSTSHWAGTEPPPLLRDMVAQRMQGLSDEPRKLIETAAVSGGEFTGQALARLVDRPILEVLRELQRLYGDRDLIVPLEHGFRFAHQLYREVIAAALSPDLRRALHRAWAEYLEAQSPTESVDPETLGWHWEQAGDPERAVVPLRRAALRAASRGEQTRAWDLAERSGILADNASPSDLREGLDLLLSLQPSFGSQEEADRVESLYARLAHAADALDDAEMRRRVRVKISWSAFFRTSVDAIDEAALQAAADALPEGPARAEAWWLLGLLARNRGEPTTARRALECADAIFAELGRSEDRASVLSALGSIHWRAGELAEAGDILRQATAAHERTGKGVHWAISRTLATFVGAQAGQREGAPAALAEPIRTLERAGQEVRAAQVRLYQAQLLEGEGRTREARETLERAEPVLREGALSGPLLLLLLARSRHEIASGELVGARETLAEVEEKAARGTPAHRAVLAVRRALLHTVEGNVAAATEQARHGLEIIAATPDRLDHARYLQELVTLACLGLDMSGMGEPLEEVAPDEGGLPRFLGLTAGVLRTLAGSDSERSDGSVYSKAASLCSQVTFPWNHAEMAIVCRLLSGRARLAEGDAEQGARELDAARELAQETEQVWLELSALRALRDAGLLCEELRTREIAEHLRQLNPGRADLADRALEHALG